MRYWPLLGILCLAVLLQTSVVPFLRVGGVVPDLLLVVVTSYGLLFGLEAGVAAGVLAGFLVDLAVGRLIGLSVLTLGSAGALAGGLEQRVYKDNLLLPFLAGLMGTFVKEGLTVAVLTAFGFRYPLWQSLTDIILPVALYNAFLCLAVYFALWRRYRYFRPDPRGHIFWIRKR